MHSALGIVPGRVGHIRRIDVLSLPSCGLQSGMRGVKRKEIQLLKRHKRRLWVSMEENALEVQRPIN